MKNYIMTSPYIRFMLIAFLSAFIYEEIPRVVLNDVHIWQGGLYVVNYFLIWYGAIFTIAYWLFKGKSPIKAAIFGIAFGMIVEAFIFHKVNVVTVFLFPFLYGSMFYIPFKAYLVRMHDAVWSKKERIILGAIVVLVILSLLPFRVG